MKEEGANTIIKSAKHMLSAAVLLRSVRASETKDRAVCGEKVAVARLSNSFLLSVCNA